MWVIFALLDPHPDTEYGSGSEKLDVRWQKLRGGKTWDP